MIGWTLEFQRDMQLGMARNLANKIKESEKIDINVVDSLSDR